MLIKRLKASQSRTKERRSGVALVVTLAILVLLSGIILAFFSQSALRRQIAYSSSGQNRAEILSRSALDTIVGDLQGEIAAGSSTDAKYTVNGISMYVPSSNQTVVPCRITGTADTTSTAFCNLVKISLGGTGAWNGTDYSSTGPIRAALDGSAYLTTTPSIDGRHIPASIWAKPFLTTGTIPTPSWILVTRSGPISNASAMPTLASMADRTTLTNTNYVIGRYAYAIYDVGGLLDINVAGNGQSSDINAQRGRMHQAALNQIPGVDGTAIVNWRNAASKSGTAWFFSGTNTFLTVSGSGDQAFVTRQDLIDYATKNPSVISGSALQYLTVFSREVNMPCYEPPTLGSAERPKVKAASNGGNPNSLGKEDTFNPSLVNERDTTTTGNPIVKQRFPLGWLAWITSDGPSTDNAVIATVPSNCSGISDAISTYFGLVWDSDNHRWIYTSPEGKSSTTPANAINPLNAIPAARAKSTGPDFFELLQASINVGSLGRDAGTNCELPISSQDVNDRASNGNNGTESVVQSADQNIYRHILQIGANIIDQARADDFPTAIRMGASGGTVTVYGIKSLPYVTRMLNFVATDYADPSGARIKFYIGTEVWNPHQSSISSVATSDKPTTFRFSACTDPENPQDGSKPSVLPIYEPMYNVSMQQNILSVATSQQLTQQIVFQASAVSASTPTLLTAANCSSESTAISTNVLFRPYNQSSYLSGTIYGIYAGYLPADPAAVTKLNAGGKYNCKLRTAPDPYAGNVYEGEEILYPYNGTTSSFVLEYKKSGSSQWYPYAVLRNIKYRGQNTSAFDCQQQTSAVGRGNCFSEIHIDPRTDRFGMVGRWTASRMTGGSDYDNFGGKTLWHDTNSPTTTTWNGISNFVPNSSAFSIPSAIYPIGNMGYSNTQMKGVYLETIADNVQTASANATNCYYADPDGVVRGAEGYYQNATYGSSDGRPMAMNGSSMVGSSQPVILHRPFRSVAELGYVFRDLPWKNLDFFSSNSGDAALLEAFSIDDTTPALNANKTPLVAGKLNLNTRNQTAIQALLAGAIMTDANAIGTGNAISATTAAAIAQKLVTRTSSPLAGQGPLRSKADLVSKFSADLTNAVYLNSTDPMIKPRREAAMRALADAGNVRTWNLMVDLIVQSGRYSANSKLGNQFLVEGEKHYWVHLAIDRFSGKVIDQFLEPVYD